MEAIYSRRGAAPDPPPGPGRYFLGGEELARLLCAIDPRRLISQP